MAGFRLAPRAAQARRNPWQRRRLTFTTSLINRTLSDGFTLSEDYYGLGGYYYVARTVAYQKTVSDGFTVTDSVVGANPSAGTATAGLIFLFSQGTSGSAYTRSVTDGFTISDSVARSLVPVATTTYNRTATDGWVMSDSVSGSLIAAGAASYLVGVDVLFTAVLDVELSFVGE